MFNIFKVGAYEGREQNKEEKEVKESRIAVEKTGKLEERTERKEGQGKVLEKERDDFNPAIEEFNRHNPFIEIKKKRKEKKRGKVPKK